MGQQIRMKDHWSQFHKTFTNISLTYKRFSIVEFSGGYRYIIYEDKEKYRLNFDSKIEINTKYLPSFRIRIEQESDLNKELEKLPMDNNYKLYISSLLKDCGYRDLNSTYKCSFYKPLISENLIN